MFWRRQRSQNLPEESERGCADTGTSEGPWRSTLSSGDSQNTLATDGKVEGPWRSTLSSGESHDTLATGGTGAESFSSGSAFRRPNNSKSSLGSSKLRSATKSFKGLKNLFRAPKAAYTVHDLEKTVYDNSLNSKKKKGKSIITIEGLVSVDQDAEVPSYLIRCFTSRLALVHGALLLGTSFVSCLFFPLTFIWDGTWEDPRHVTRLGERILMMDIVVDCFFFFLIMCQFNISHMNHVRRVEIVTRKGISMHYMKSFLFWTRLLSASSYIWISAFNWPLLMNNIKVVRFVHLLRFPDSLWRLKDKRLVNLLRPMILLSLASHWTACLMVSLGGYAESLRSEGPEFFATTFQGKRVSSHFSLYLMAFVESLYMLTGALDNPLGEGDGPRNKNFGSLLIVTIFGPIGCVIAALLIAAIIRQHTLKFALDMRHEENSEFIKRALQNLNIPTALQRRVFSLQYYQKMSHDHEAFDALFKKSNLSPPLESALRIYLYHDSVLNSQYFKDKDHNYILEVIRVLEDQIFLPGDYVTRRGEVDSKMFFVAKGELAVLVPAARNGADVTRATAVGMKKKGEYFGEIALIRDCVRTAWVRSDSYVLVSTLERTKIEDIWRYYPDERAKLVLNVTNVARQDRARRAQQLRMQTGSSLNTSAETVRTVPSTITSVVDPITRGRAHSDQWSDGETDAPSPRNWQPDADEKPRSGSGGVTFKESVSYAQTGSMQPMPRGSVAPRSPRHEGASLPPLGEARSTLHRSPPRSPTRSPPGTPMISPRLEHIVSSLSADNDGASPELCADLLIRDEISATYAPTVGRARGFSDQSATPSLRSHVTFQETRSHQSEASDLQKVKELEADDDIVRQTQLRRSWHQSSLPGKAPPPRSRGDSSSFNDGLQKLHSKLDEVLRKQIATASRQSMTSMHERIDEILLRQRSLEDLVSVALASAIGPSVSTRDSTNSSKQEYSTRYSKKDPKSSPSDWKRSSRAGRNQTSTIVLDQGGTGLLDAAGPSQGLHGEPWDPMGGHLTPWGPPGEPTGWDPIPTSCGSSNDENGHSSAKPARRRRRRNGPGRVLGNLPTAPPERGPHVASAFLNNDTAVSTSPVSFLHAHPAAPTALPAPVTPRSVANGPLAVDNVLPHWSRPDGRPNAVGSALENSVERKSPKLARSDLRRLKGREKQPEDGQNHDRSPPGACHMPGTHPGNDSDSTVCESPARAKAVPRRLDVTI